MKAVVLFLGLVFTITLTNTSTIFAASSPNLSIPHLSANQTNPDVTINDAIDRLDKALADSLSVAVTTADVTLTSTEALENVYILTTGTLTADRALIFPTNKKFYFVEHGSGGGFNITLKTAAQVGGVVLANGDRSLIYCDGTNIIEIIGGGGAGSGITASSTDTLTNKTIDAEGSGNVITIPFSREFAMAGCEQTEPGPIWDLPEFDSPTPICVTGTNTQKGTLRYADGQTAQMTWILPQGLSGTADFRLVWSSPDTSATGTWILQGVCTATDGTATDDPAFGAFWSPSEDTSPGTANRLQTTSATGVSWPASCVAGTLLHLELIWTANTATNFDAISLEITYRRAM